MAENEVVFEINAKVDDAMNAVKSLERSATSSVSAISNAFGSLKVVAGAALGFLAGRAVVNFFQDSIAAASEADQEIAKLEASLRSVGDYTPEAVEAFDAFATGLERSSKFTGEAVLSQVTLAKQMGLTNKEAEQLVQASADLASVTGDSLETSFSELSKTLKGSAGALSNTIPEVKSFTEEQLKSGAAIDLVAERLKGASRDSIKTYAGAMTQLTNATGNVQEELGKVITQNPVIVAALQAASKAFQNLETLITENKEIIAQYIGEAVKLGAKALPLAIDAVNLLIKGLGGLVFVAAKVVEINAAMIEGFLSLKGVQKAISLFSDAVTGYYSLIFQGVSLALKSIAESSPLLALLFKELGVDVIKIAEELEGASKKFSEFKLETKDFDKTIKNIKGLKDSAADFGDGVAKATLDASDGMDNFKKIVEDSARDITRADGDIARAAKDAATAQTVAGQSIVKASVEASKARLKNADDEKKLTDERKKAHDEAIKLMESLTLKTSTNEEKIQLEKLKTFEEIKRLTKEGGYTEEQAALARVKASELAAKQSADNREKEKKEYQDFLDTILSKETDSLRKIEVEKNIHLERNREFLRKGEVLKGEYEANKLAIEEDYLQKAEAARLAAAEKEKTATSEKFKDIIGIASSALSSGGQGALQALVQVIGDRFIPGLGSLFSQVVGILSASADEFETKINSMFDEGFIKNILTNIGTLVQKIPEIIDETGNLIDFAPIVGDLIKSVVSMLPTLLAEALKLYPEGLEVLVSAIVNGVAEGLGEAGKKLETAAKTAVNDIGREAEKYFGTEWKKTLYDIFSLGGYTLTKELLKILENAGHYLARGFGNVMEGIGRALTVTFEYIGARLTALFSSSFDGIGRKLTLVFSNFGEAIRKTFEGIGTFFQENIIKPIGELFTKFGSALTTEFTNFGNFIADIPAKIGDGATKIFDKIKEGFASFGEFFQPVIDELKTGFDNVFGGAGTVLENAFGDFDTTVAGFFEDIGTAFTDIFGPIYEKLEAAFNNPLKAFTDLLEGIKKAMQGPTEGIKDGFKNATSSPENIAKNLIDPGGLTQRFGKAIGLAEGGLVPKGYPNDTFPARLTSDELVVPTDLVHRLQNMIARDESGGGDSNGVMVALLNKIANLLAQPTQISTTAEIDGRALAEIILQLNRNNARLTA